MYNFSRDSNTLFEELQHYTEMLDRKISVYEDETFNSLRSVVALIQKQNHVHSLKRTKDLCRSSMIPDNLISLDTLREKFKDLNTKIKVHGYIVALKVENADELLKIPIADCMFTEKSVFVVINIPIVRISSQCQLYEVVHTNFAFENQTCSLYPQEASYIAESHTQIVFINSYLLRHCSIHELGMCLMPLNTMESADSLQCAVGILQRKPIEDLRNSCLFKCSDNSELIITQVDDNHVFLTNVDILTENCSGFPPVSHHFDKIGSNELKMSCSCSYTANNRKLVPSLTCFEQEKDNDYHVNVFQTIPKMWSNEKFAVSFFSERIHSEVSGVLVGN